MSFSAIPTSSLIDSLPPELLTLIFRTTADLPLSRAECTPAPLVFASVSPRWRAIALNSPEIWTSIRISADRPPAIAALFLTRSAPYMFRLTLDTASEIEPQVVAAETLRLLRPHLARCTVLALSLCEQELKDWTAALRGDGELSALSAVRTVSLAIHNHSASVEMWGPPSCVTDFAAFCTNAHALRLACALPRLCDGLNLPPRLTTLDLRCSFEGAYVYDTICLHAHALETLVLREYAPSVLAPGAPILTLPSITSLTLAYRDTALGEGLLSLARSFALPHLRRLTIRGSNERSLGYAQVLDGGIALTLSFPRLRELHLQDVRLDRALDIRVLQELCSEITHLRLANVVEQLGSGAGLLTPFAHLRVLEIPRDPARVELPRELAESVVVRRVSHRRHADVDFPELDFYLHTDGSVTEFEPPAPVAHVCSDFCAFSDYCQVDDDLSPWRDMRSDAERLLDQARGGQIAVA
ncbi:hypothetical protein C8R46DRAFT_1140563 [Mycena filopes]|nr:hypothetical protein C8R46DRAFT_1140563 [Mycena filopes]